MPVKDSTCAMHVLVSQIMAKLLPKPKMCGQHKGKGIVLQQKS